MPRKILHAHIGMRTIKTAVSVLIAMAIVDQFGATAEKLIFAMLGAMSAVQPTFRASIEVCLTQIVGVICGALAGVLLLTLPIGQLTATGIGIVLILSAYNLFHSRLSPSLPCFVLVTLCTTPGIAPISYGLGRIWDTAIGLGVGLLINTLVCPYDNSRTIRSAIESLDRAMIAFLEDMFDGDGVLPDAAGIEKKLENMVNQLDIFADQRLVLHLRRQKRELEEFRTCERKARELTVQMAALVRMGPPGRLNEENRRRLAACGAEIRDRRPLDSVMELDVVTNYHVRQILTLRRELLEALGGN